VPRAPTGTAALQISRPTAANLPGMQLATQAVQHVANDGNLVLDHRVLALAQLAVEFSQQYSRILHALHDLLSSAKCSEVVQVHCDIDVDIDGDECAQRRVSRSLYTVRVDPNLA